MQVQKQLRETEILITEKNRINFCSYFDGILGLLSSISQIFKNDMILNNFFPNRYIIFIPCTLYLYKYSIKNSFKCINNSLGLYEGLNTLQMLSSRYSSLCIKELLKLITCNLGLKSS